MKVREKNELLRNSFTVMESAVNAIEIELRKNEPSWHLISFHFGKIYETYREVNKLINIFPSQNIDKQKK